MMYTFRGALNLLVYINSIEALARKDIQSLCNGWQVWVAYRFLACFIKLLPSELR